MQHRIPLNKTAPATNSGSAVKTLALATFRFLRASSEQASRLPGIVQQASSDIVQAWQESASPKKP